MTVISKGNGVSLNTLSVLMLGQANRTCKNAALIIHFKRMKQLWRGATGSESAAESDGGSKPSESKMVKVGQNAIRQSEIPRYRIAKDPGVHDSALCRIMQVT